MLGAFAPVTAAGAHDVSATITPPASAPSEDSEFSIVFTGDATSLPYGTGYLEAKIRRVTNVPCAASDTDDPGDDVATRPSLSGRVAGAFEVTGTYVADTPGEYLICAWVESNELESGPPASATMTVRPPVLALTATAPASARRGAAFPVAVSYQAEVPRQLTVLVAHASGCSTDGTALRHISARIATVADDVTVSGSGFLTSTVRLDTPGTYLVCGFLGEKAVLGSTPAQLVVRAATVTVPGPMFASCGGVGGRRQVRDIRARAVSCAAARALARRWAARRPAPRRLGGYRCFVHSGTVTCTAGAAQVQFRVGRGRRAASG
jgi:hypothetical protein